MTAVAPSPSAVPLTARERKLLQKRTRTLSLILLAVAGFLLFVAIMQPDWTALPNTPADLIMLSLCSIPLIYLARRTSRVREDLALGVKLIGDGVVDRKCEHEGDSSTTYSIYVSVTSLSEPLWFRVPEATHAALEKSHAVHIAYAPRSETLFELYSDNHHYIAVD